MSTRCRIAYRRPDNTVVSIYCHHDGYPDGVGQMLKDFYTDSDIIEQLMALGDLSSLGEKPVSDPKAWTDHTIDTTKCVAYKDRGENTPAQVHTGLKEYLNDLKDGLQEEYNYLFYRGIWHELELVLDILQ